MKELSLNILDIAENSVKAGASHIRITLCETPELFEFSVADDGCGMDKALLERVMDPFCTSRTTRKVGMGIPLLKLAAEQTGGTVSIVSRCEAEYPKDHGTVVTANFHKNHIDFMPVGDMISTVATLIQGSPDIDFLFLHRLPGDREVRLDTRELREILGDVSLSNTEVIMWIKEYLSDQYNDRKN